MLSYFFVLLSVMQRRGHSLLHVVEEERLFCLAMDFGIFGYLSTFQLGVPAISPISAISAS